MNSPSVSVMISRWTFPDVKTAGSALCMLICSLLFLLPLSCGGTTDETRQPAGSNEVVPVDPDYPTSAVVAPGRVYRIWKSGYPLNPKEDLVVCVKNLGDVGSKAIIKAIFCYLDGSREHFLLSPGMSTSSAMSEGMSPVLTADAVLTSGGRGYVGWTLR